MEKEKFSKIKEKKGMTLIELIVGMALLSVILLGLIPILTMVMKGNVRDRWDTLAMQRAEELIEIIKRVASTSTGYASGDTNDDGSIDSGTMAAPTYREVILSNGNHQDPFNPIRLSAGASGIFANRRYSVATTVVGITSYKTVTVWVEPINSSLLRTVTIETIISEP
ncbi:type II secretion system protein [bacterium]|nr:type II secretion system protein [bacterium]